jgi:hypothetical protein
MSEGQKSIKKLFAVIDLCLTNGAIRTYQQDGNLLVSHLTFNQFIFSGQFTNQEFPPFIFRKWGFEIAKPHLEISGKVLTM